MNIVPVILCGGKGTRLWPKSRAARPKPFLKLVGDETLFAATLARCEGFSPPLVVTGRELLPLVEEQAPGAAVIVEPEGRNTAPAIALAAHRLPPDAVMLVCPSDHHIADEEAFRAAARDAAALAAAGWLVAFGIPAHRPETGYGYIRRGEAIDGGWRIERFVEKPDLASAKAFLAEGGYSWNGGIFGFRAGDYLAELARMRPAMSGAVHAAVTGGRADGTHFHPETRAFAAIEAESVDYAVMEGTDRAAMVEADMGWSDIGNWQALREARLGEVDEDGNILRGPVDIVDSQEVMVESDGPRVSVVGVDGVIVVVDKGEVLVTSARGAPQVGKLRGASEQ